MRELIGEAEKLLEKGKTIDSIRLLQQSLKSEEIDRATLGDACYLLSDAYHRLGKNEAENALNYAKEALNIHRSLSEKDSVIDDLINLAHISADFHGIDEAKKYIEEAVDECTNDTQRSIVYLAYGDLLSLTKTGRKMALELYEKVLSLAGDNISENYFAAKYGIISTLRDEGKIEESYKLAKEVVDEIGDYCATLSNKKQKANLKKSLSYIYDVASDLAMELNLVNEALEIVKKMKV